MTVMKRAGERLSLRGSGRPGRLLTVAFIVGATIVLMPMVVGAATADDAATESNGIEASHAFEHRMTRLVLEIGIILFAGYAGARVARRLGVPAILGEVIAGIIIGPHMLGSLALPGYPAGIFAHSGTPFLISPELYGFAVVASIVLLFLMGLETDIRLFLRFAVTGSVVGVGGALLAVIGGVLVGQRVVGAPIADPRVLFLGVVAIATSVDITGRILSERHKMASPEGVTILSASVIEDVIGITMLAVILGVDAIGLAAPDRAVLREVGSIAFRAVAVWLGFTTLGLVFARRISGVLKRVGNAAQIAVLSLGLAFILAGLFEAAGLAMIIGAYVMGLSLANTDIAYVVQEKIETVHTFFDPIFFTVTGMLVNVAVLISGEVIIAGLLFTAVAIGSKVIGTGVPSLALGFTPAGAARVAMGLVPRGEVALVIASIGLGAGILDDRLFGIAVFMTLATTLTGPPLFNRLLQRDARTMRREVARDDTVETAMELESRELTDLVAGEVRGMMRAEGYFVNTVDGAHPVHQMRRDASFIAMHEDETALRFVSAPSDLALVSNLVYETVLSLQRLVERVGSQIEPDTLRRAAAEATGDQRSGEAWYRYLPLEAIHLDLGARDKASAIDRLIDSLVRAGRVTDRDEARTAVWERERTMSTGLQNGIAIPHGRCRSVAELSVAVGIVPRGIDFDSLDGEPTTLIFLVLSPADPPGPHLQVLAAIGAATRDADARVALRGAATRADLVQLLARGGTA